ncbi:MAG TPA: zinc ribbon domain-containing protein [Dongiaceae bacterium]|jgi:putative FmdB family regulatory protein
MPIHDFQCRRCGHRFEQLVKPDESPACPACGATGAERQFSYSAAISTSSSRQRALAGARRRASAVKKEKDRAHQIYLANHIKDHS